MVKKTYKTEDRVFSSDYAIDMDKEFMLCDFPTLRKENSPVYGAADASEVVISPLNLDQLGYLLNAEGTHLILFGGSWSAKTNAVIDRINYYARKYGVDTVHQFDFAPDGIAEHTIKQDITAQEGYDGPDKTEENPFAKFNFFYGEFCTRHLTNLNDWVARKAGVNGDITYLNRFCDAVSVPCLEEPFLFLYNKDNTVNHSGSDTVAEHYPIVYAMELEAYRGEDGTLYSDPAKQDESTVIKDFDEQLIAGIFSHIGTDCPATTPFTKADHLREALRINGRGHSIKTEEGFHDGEQINLQMINLQELRWLVNQKGSFIILVAGPWCTFSQGSMPTINDYAVANNLRVYIADIRVDDKYQIDAWEYTHANEMSLGSPAFLPYFFELWEDYFKNAEILVTNNTRGVTSVRRYTDENGEEHVLHTVGVPFLLAYNKDNTEGGRPKPILCSRHDSGQLINTIPNYAYYEPVYKEYKGSVLKVFSAYARSLGQTAKECTVDRTKPLVEGHEQHNPNVAGAGLVVKEHNWYVERADRVR